MENRRIRERLAVLAIIFVFIFNSSCIPIVPTIEPTPEATAVGPFVQDISYAESTFFLKLPLPVNEDLVIEVVDDVTGIELNPTRYLMEKLDAVNYSVTIPLKIGSIVKYRYYQNGGLPVYETDSFNHVIKYRAAYIDNAHEFYDEVSNWANQQNQYVYGRVEGRILNSNSNAPLPGLMVIVGGAHTFTNSLGQFAIEKLAPGKHRLLVLSTDGEYQNFQQEVIVGEESTTTADVTVAPSQFVNVTFFVSSPVENPGQPLRMFGNMYQLGNVFGSVYNGESVIASRAPILNELPDGSYTITLSLPVGFNLVYKYSFGNGFWNSELTEDGHFMLRDIIIPTEETVIHDVITAFMAPDSGPIQFNLSIPPATPANDTISIQFSPFGWSSPIPMTRLETGIYSFTLYSPLNMVESSGYRYCRNDACELAADTASVTANAPGHKFEVTNFGQEINDAVADWTNLSAELGQTEIIVPQIKVRGPEFLAGFEQTAEYDVFQSKYSTGGYQSMKELSANAVIIPIEWTLQSLNPVVLAPVAGENPLWKDSLSQISNAQNQGLQVLLAPKLSISTNALNELFVGSLQRSWELKFTDYYMQFLIYAADMAQLMGARGLVIPTKTLNSSNLNDLVMLNQVLVNNLPEQMLDLREHFAGEIFIELNPVVDQIEQSTLELFDHIFITASWDLRRIPANAEDGGEDGNGDENGGAGEEIIDGEITFETLTQAFRGYLENEVLAIQESTQLPVTIVLDYPSAKGAERGCVIMEDECISFDLANQMTAKQQIFIETDVGMQRDIYQAALAAINEQEWISGFISNGYNIQLTSHDSSSSVRGKPAGDLLWYWFPKLLGIDN